MNGEPTVRPPNPPEEGDPYSEHPRPPCAVLFLSALGRNALISSSSSYEEVEEITEEMIRDVVDAIDYGIYFATAEEHNNCLKGKDIKCPLLERNNDQLITIIRNLTRTLTPVSIRRLEKTLSVGIGSGPNPMDSPLRSELKALGIDQELGLVKEPVGLPGPSATVPDPRVPSRVMEERIINNPQERPPCAPSLNRFFEARTAAIGLYDEKRRRAKNPDRIKMDHTADEKFYDETIVQIRTSNPSEADCKACVIDCPPKHGVPPKAAYDTLHRTVSLPSGGSIIPSDIMQYILRGLPRNRLIGPPEPNESLRKLDSTLIKLSERHGEEYFVPNLDGDS